MCFLNGPVRQFIKFLAQIRFSPDWDWTIRWRLKVSAELDYLLMTDGMFLHSYPHKLLMKKMRLYVTVSEKWIIPAISLSTTKTHVLSSVTDKYNVKTSIVMYTLWAMMWAKTVYQIKRVLIFHRTANKCSVNVADDKIQTSILPLVSEATASVNCATTAAFIVN